MKRAGGAMAASSALRLRIDFSREQMAVGPISKARAPYQRLHSDSVPFEGR